MISVNLAALRVGIEVQLKDLQSQIAQAQNTVANASAKLPLKVDSAGVQTQAKSALGGGLTAGALALGPALALGFAKVQAETRAMALDLRSGMARGLAPLRDLDRIMRVVSRNAAFTEDSLRDLHLADQAGRFEASLKRAWNAARGVRAEVEVANRVARLPIAERAAANVFGGGNAAGLTPRQAAARSRPRDERGRFLSASAAPSAAPAQSALTRLRAALLAFHRDASSLRPTLGQIYTVARTAFHGTRAAVVGAAFATNALERGMRAVFRELGVIAQFMRPLGVALVAPWKAAAAAIQFTTRLLIPYQARVDTLTGKLARLGPLAAPLAAPIAALGAGVDHLGRAFGSMAQAATVALGASTAALTVATLRASNLNETVNKVNTVFDEGAESVSKWADEQARAWGISRQTSLDAAAQFGLLAKSAGLAGEESARFSTELVQLAQDASSFYNLPLAEVLAKFRSGLVGEAEPMRALGVLLDEDTVKAQALASGLATSADSVSQAAKVQSRAALIIRGLSDAQGDLARTADQPANLMRILSGRIENLSTDIGQAALPAFRALLQTFEMVGSNGSTIFNDLKATFVSWGQTAAEWIGVVGVAYRNWALFTEIGALTISARLKNVGEVFAWLGSTARVLADWFATNWLSILTDAFRAASTAFSNLVANISSAFTELMDFLASGGANPIDIKLKPLLDGANLKTLAPDLPTLELSGIDQDRLNELTQAISEAEAARQGLATGTGTGPVKRGVLGIEGLARDADKAKQGRQSSAGEVVDLAQFRSVLQKSALEKRDETARQQLAEQRATTEAVRGVAAAVRTLPMGLQ